MNLYDEENLFWCEQEENISINVVPLNTTLEDFEINHVPPEVLEWRVFCYEQGIDIWTPRPSSKHSTNKEKS
jgi:hypothetical protein